MGTSQMQVGPELIEELEELEAAAIELAGEHRLQEANELWKRHLDLARVIYGDAHEKTFAAMNALGESHFTVGDLPSAVATFRLAVELSERNMGPDSITTATMNQGLGNMLSCTGAYAEAETFMRRALDIMTRERGISHNDTAGIIHDLGLLLMRNDDYSGAEPLLRQALEIFEESHEPTATGIATATHTLGNLLLLKGDFEGAQVLMQEALQAREEILGSDHTDTALSVRMLGDILCARGDLIAAEPLYLRALAIQERALGPCHPQLAHMLFDYALVFERRDTKADDLAAVELFRRLLDIYKTTHCTGFRLSYVHSHLGRLLGNQGFFDEAEQLLLRALEILLPLTDPDDEDLVWVQEQLAIVRNNRVAIKEWTESQSASSTSSQMCISVPSGGA